MSVYFARVGDYVKVGYSAAVEKRIQRIRTDQSAKPQDLDPAAPVELLRVIDGDRGTELAAHIALYDFYATGEWFIAEPELLEHIETMTEPPFAQAYRPAGLYSDPKRGIPGDVLAAAAASVSLSP